MFDLRYGKDCRDTLRSMPDNSVHACITSPPYWGLRQYPGQEHPVWGGDPNCTHVWEQSRVSGHRGDRGQVAQTKTGHKGLLPQEVGATCANCVTCAAWRGQLGHETTPEQFVQHLVEVFREVRRVLHPEGLLWVNLGDSYAAAGAHGGGKA